MRLSPTDPIATCAPLQHDADDRGPHPGVVVGALGGAEHAAVGQADRRPQAVAVERQ